MKKQEKITMIYSYLRDAFENRGYMYRFSPTADIYEYERKIKHREYAVGNRASYSIGHILPIFEI